MNLHDHGVSKHRGVFDQEVSNSLVRLGGALSSAPCRGAQRITSGGRQSKMCSLKTQTLSLPDSPSI